MTARLTAADLAAMRERHRRQEMAEEDTGGHMRPADYCHECGEDWPCDAVRLLAALDAETAHRRAAEDDLAAMTARADAAEVHLPTKGGGTLVVTAAELYAAHEQARAIAERAQCWAAAWKSAAKAARADHRPAEAREFRRRYRARIRALTTERDDLFRELAALRAEHDALLARAAYAGMFPAETAAVVAAARACAPILAQWPEGRRLAAALAALDAATQQE